MPLPETFPLTLSPDGIAALIECCYAGRRDEKTPPGAQAWARQMLDYIHQRWPGADAHYAPSPKSIALPEGASHAANV